MSMWSNEIKYKYVFMFHLKKIARKELIKHFILFVSLQISYSYYMY